MRFACTDFAFRSKLLHAQSCTNFPPLALLVRESSYLSTNKNMTRWSYFYLAEEERFELSLQVSPD